MNEQLKIIAEFVDEASAGLRRTQERIDELTRSTRDQGNQQDTTNRQTRAGAAATEASINPLQLAGRAVAGWAAALGVAALAWQGLTSALAEADKFDDLSEKVQMSASELRDLSFAANQSGTSLDALIGAMAKLGKAADMSDDAATKQAQTFKQLGIDTMQANGQLKSTEQLMLEVADRFKNLEDGPEKSAAAFRLFGGEAKNLLPFLNQGSEAITALKEESRSLAILSPKAFDTFAKGVGVMNDNIDKLGTVSNGFFQALAEQLVPTINIMAAAFINSAKEGGMLRNMFNLLVGVVNNVVVPTIKVAAVTFGALVTTLDIAGKSIGAVLAAIAVVASGGGVEGLKSVWNSYTSDVEEAVLSQGRFAFSLYRTEDAAGDAADGLDKPKDKLKSLTKDAKATTSALDAFIKTMKDAKFAFDFVPDNAPALDAARARDIWAQTAALQKDIEAGMSKSAAMAKYRAADELSAARDVQRRYEAAVKARDAVGFDNKTKADELKLLAYENSLVGMGADERERLMQIRRDEIALNKQWADTASGSNTEDAMVNDLFEQTKAIQARAAALKKASDEAAIANDIFDNSIGAAQDAFTQRIQIAVKMFEAGKISLQDFTQYQQEQYDALLNKTKDTTEKSTLFWEEAAKGMQDAMQTFFYDIMQGNMTNLVDDFQKMISKMVAEALAANLGEKLFGTNMGKGGAGGLIGAAGNWLSTAFGGFRAGGGPVSSGKAYVVGENRPELFVPDTSGTIIPSLDGLAGNGVTVHMSVNATDSRSFLGQMGLVERELASIVHNATRKYNLGS